MKQNQHSLEHFNAFKLSCLLLALSVISSCSKDEQEKVRFSDQTVNITNLKLVRPDIVVTTGSSIQAAVDNAQPGDVIHIQPGIYHEAIVVDIPNIKMVGLTEGSNGVIIENPGGEDDGIRVRSNGDGFELYHVTIQHFLENGVIMIRADNFVISHVTTINCGEYGLWPIRSSHGLIEHCTASGHTDSGIYTGQSEDIVMRFNRVFNNTIGLEIENCSNVTATNNQCYDNVAGILVVLLPGLSVTESSDIYVGRNHVFDNNKVNTADPADGFEAFVPSGSGVLVVGTDNTTIEQNTVQKNSFLGIAVVSSLVLGALSGTPPEAFAGIEPNPDGARIIKNVVNTNGTIQPALPFPAVDLLWDGSGSGNCWSENNYSTAYPVNLPACF